MTFRLLYFPAHLRFAFWLAKLLGGREPSNTPELADGWEWVAVKTKDKWQ